MGLWGKIKGWLNIGGVKVLLWKYTEPLKRSEPVITGAVLLKTKNPKEILGVEVRAVEEFSETEGEGEDKKTKTKTTVMGAYKFPEHDAGVGYPFELKAGEQKEQPFTLPVTLPNRLQTRSGVLGGIGKLAAFAGGEKVKYFLIAEARVKGAAFKPSDKQQLKIGD